MSASAQRSAVLCVVALVPVAVLAVSSIVLASNQVTSVVDSQVQTTAAVSAEVIGQQTDSLVALVNSYATRPSLVSALSGEPGSDTAIDLNLASLVGAVPGISASFVADVDGTSRNTYPRIPSAIGKNFSYREWFTGLAASGRPYVSSAIVTAEDSHTLAVTITDYIRDAHGRPIGILGVNYSLTSIGVFAADVGGAQGISLLVTDRTGTSLTSLGKNGLVSVTDDPRVRAALAGGTGLMDYAPVSTDGRKGPVELSAYAPVPGTGWTVVASKDKGIAFAGLARLRAAVLSITALLVVILLAGVGVIVRSDRRRRIIGAELETERRRLTEAQRLGQMGGFECDFATGNWVFSGQMFELWGVEPGGVLDEVIEGLIHESDREMADSSWADALRLGGRHIQEFRMRRASDGAERVLRATLEVDLGPDDEPLRVRGTHLDITDLTIAEKAAKRANAFFDAVLAASPDFTFVSDLVSGTPVYTSRGKDLLGMQADQLQALGPDATAQLVHPEDRPRLAAINTAAADLEDGHVLQLHYRAQHVDGRWHWLSRRITPFRRDADGAVVEVLGVVRDISDVMESEQRLTHAALHDGLTGLPNRALLTDRLEAALARSARDGREVAVLFCDLDGFKRVNDIAGHAAGDALLLEIAQRLHEVVREHDTVARVGGDEFVIIVEPWNRADAPAHGNTADEEFEADRLLAVQVAKRVAAVLQQPVMVKGVNHVVSASIGITYATLGPGGPAGTITAEQVLQDADTAMYLAKGRGRDRFEVFEHGVHTDVAERVRVEQLLREALSHLSQPAASAVGKSGPSFTAAYQPVFDSGTGALTGFEALARLIDGDGLNIAPDVFIPIAEATGIIHPLGRAMLGLACGQLQGWRAEIPGLEHVSMAVNISALQAQHASLAEDVRDALTTAALDPADLVLELTETALLQVANSTISALRALRAEGVGIAIDDFGIGYASLRYLATLPVSAVKIDRTFTAGLPHDETSRKIVKAVAALAADMGLTCIVEGVETEEQREALPSGVHLQGFLTGRPQLPAGMDVLTLCAQGAG